MTSQVQAGTAPPSGLSFRGLVLPRLSGLTDGQLTLREGGARTTFGSPARDGLSAEVVVRHPAFWRRVATGGTLGSSESYAAGEWDTPDLTSVVRLVARNVAAMDGLEGGLATLRRPVDAVLHALRRNTRAGSRRNIAEHYDLGDDFFELMLDPTMTYSCGVFEQPGATLEEASIAKIDRLCRMLRLGPEDHLLEIGTGWGGLAIHAATRYGCRVTTTTISREQHEWAAERVRAAGVSDRVTVLLDDYRDLRGRYDKLVSVEMIEAVGHQFLDTYTARCSQLLEPHGAMLLQAITIQDQLYEQALGSVDFIQRFIFPGSFIPSITAITDSVRRSTDMKVFHLEDIGPHYATTLRAWRERFFARLDDVRRLGYPEEFIRMWHFYLCYCEGGFLERQLGDVHMLLTKPRCRLPAA